MGAREPWGDWDTLHLPCRLLFKRHRNGTAVAPSPLTLGILPPLNPPSSHAGAHSSLLCPVSSSSLLRFSHLHVSAQSLCPFGGDAMPPAL